jgi:hypothetical protein
MYAGVRVFFKAPLVYKGQRRLSFIQLASSPCTPVPYGHIDMQISPCKYAPARRQGTESAEPVEPQGNNRGGGGGGCTHHFLRGKGAAGPWPHLIRDTAQRQVGLEGWSDGPRAACMHKTTLGTPSVILHYHLRACGNGPQRGTTLWPYEKLGLSLSLGAPSPEQGTGNREMDTSSVIRSVPNEDSALTRVALCLHGEQLLGRLAVGACYLAKPRHIYVSALRGRSRKRANGR